MKDFLELLEEMLGGKEEKMKDREIPKEIEKILLATKKISEIHNEIAEYINERLDDKQDKINWPVIMNGWNNYGDGGNSFGRIMRGSLWRLDKWNEMKNDDNGKKEMN